MADDRDVIRSEELQDRHDYLNESALSLLQGSAAEINAQKIVARAELDENQLTAVYSAVMPAAANTALRKWSLHFADFLFNARAALDNVMWLVAHDSPVTPLTDREENSLYFPIAGTKQQWTSFAGSPAAKKIRPLLLDRLEAVQPFRRPNRSGSQGLVYMNGLHKADKHRIPLGLDLMLDFQLPTLLDINPQDGRALRFEDQWLDFEKPVVNGAKIMQIRADRPVLPPPDLRLNLIPMANLDGERYDLQDLVWDVQSAVTRSIDAICFDFTIRADLFDADVAWRRESLISLRRSMNEQTDEWGRRGFNLSPPYEQIIDELNKEHPDLSKLVGIETPSE